MRRTELPQRRVELPVMGGVEVRYVDVNPGASKTLLLLHGHGSRVEEVESLIYALGDEVRVLAFDLPGCGDSDKPDVHYSIAGYEEVVAAFLAKLEVSRCVLAGGGLGGNLTLRVACRRPQLVARAVAWSVAGWGKKKRGLAVGARLLVHAPAFVFWRVVERQIPEQYSKDFAERERFIREDLDYRREVYGRAYHRAYFQIAADQVGTSMLSRAREIEPPVTLLAGAKDDGPLGIPGAVQHLADVMGVEAHMLESGYALHQEQPAQLADYIRAELASV